MKSSTFNPVDSNVAGGGEDGDNYEPRRSNRIKQDLTNADGDIWEEKLVVCEASAEKLVIRSYFKNSRTGRRVWDEPPTGASHIEHASSATRQEREEELQNLQMALSIQKEETEERNKKAGKGFFSGFLRKGNKTNDETVKGGGGGRFNFNKKNNSQVSEHYEMEGDEDLQRAISLSMGLQEPPNHYENEGNQEDIDMAKALSMSLNADSGVTPQYESSQDDEMLRQAIEASQLTAAASMSPPLLPTAAQQEDDILGLMNLFDKSSMSSQPETYMQGGKTTGASLHS